MRGGARDRVVGLLTERSARTLLYYLQETNLNVFYWLQAYMQAYPIPRARPALFGDVLWHQIRHLICSLPHPQGTSRLFGDELWRLACRPTPSQVAPCLVSGDEHWCLSWGPCGRGRRGPEAPLLWFGATHYHADARTLVLLSHVHSQ